MMETVLVIEHDAVRWVAPREFGVLTNGRVAVFGTKVRVDAPASPYLYEIHQFVDETVADEFMRALKKRILENPGARIVAVLKPDAFEFIS